MLQSLIPRHPGRPVHRYVHLAGGQRIDPDLRRSGGIGISPTAAFTCSGPIFCFTVLKYLGPYFWLGLLLGPLCVCAVGYFLERFFLRYVYHLALPYQLLLTFAFVLIFDDLVKILWGAGSVSPPGLAALSGSVDILGRKFPIYNLFIIGVGPLVALGLWG